MSKRANFFSIGIFVIVAFFLLATAFVYFGAISVHKNTAVIVATFRGSTNGLRLGAKVKAYGVEIGQVKSIMLHRLPNSDEVVIPVLMEIDLDHVSTLMGYKNYTAFLDSPHYQDLGIEAYATLQSESVLTGLLYVEIVFGQGSEGYVLQGDRFADLQSIPTQPTEMELMFQSLQDVAHHMSKIDFSGLVEEVTLTVKEFRAMMAEMDVAGLQQSVDSLLQDTETLVKNPELADLFTEMGQLVRNLNRITGIVDQHAGTAFVQLRDTLSELEKVAAETRQWVNPSSAVYVEAVDALDQLGDASRSLRNLVEYLERNPNALLTGKPIKEKQP